MHFLQQALQSDTLQRCVYASSIELCLLAQGLEQLYVNICIRTV